MRTLSLAALLLLVFPAATFEAQPKREAWQWTLEERIAARTDPAAARARVEIDDQRTRAAGREIQRSEIADIFYGKDHPELFLPYELFDDLVTGAFTTSVPFADHFRASLTPELRRREFPADFWLRLEAISSAYTADYRAIKALLVTINRQSGDERRKSEQKLEIKYRDGCRSRMEALAQARGEFGRERFDRFLYEVVAYPMFHAGDTLPSPDRLRYAEQGCR